MRGLQAISEVHNQQVFVLKLFEESLDISNHLYLKRMVREAIDRKQEIIVLDFTRVNTIDSAALVTLLSCHKMVCPHGMLIISAPSPQVISALSITRLNKTFTICKNLAAAQSFVEKMTGTRLIESLDVGARKTLVYGQRVHRAARNQALTSVN